MKLALIPPLSFLEYTNRTNYQLMLPQLACPDWTTKLGDTELTSTQATEYGGKYSQLAHSGQQYVMLDNGANEGAEFDPDVLINIARQWEVQEVIMPDVIGDKDQTIGNALAFHDHWKRQTEDEFLWNLDVPRLAFVPQGQNFEEYNLSVRWAAEMDWIDTLSIPRAINKVCRSPYARLTLASEVHQRWPGRFEIHLLGGDPAWPKELLEASTCPYVRGMDTSAPFNYAYYYRYIDEVSETGINRPPDYFIQGKEVFRYNIAEYNLFTMLRWARGKDLRRV